MQVNGSKNIQLTVIPYDKPSFPSNSDKLVFRYPSLIGFFPYFEFDEKLKGQHIKIISSDNSCELEVEVLEEPEFFQMPDIYNECFYYIASKTIYAKYPQQLEFNFNNREGIIII